MADRVEERLGKLEARSDKLDEEQGELAERLTRVESNLEAHATRSNERHAEVLGKLTRLEDGIHVSPKWVPFVLAALFGGSAAGAWGSNTMTSPAPIVQQAAS